MTKICFCCKIEKSHQSFNKDSTKIDGLYSVCKICRSIKIKSRYKYKHKSIRKTEEEKKQRRKEWRSRNRLIINEKRRNKRNTDIEYKLKYYLRTRLNKVVKRNYRAGSAVRDLGCNSKELKIHLEKQFQPGMNWENYGKWHIDHIIPLSRVDLKVREEFLKVSHYTNLRPLWAIDNLKKGNKMENNK